MNSLKNPNDDMKWLDQLLREDAAGQSYIEDQGFSAQVVTALPARRRQRQWAWLSPALGAIGAVLIGTLYGPSIAHALVAPLSHPFTSWQALVTAWTPLAVTAAALAAAALTSLEDVR